MRMPPRSVFGPSSPPTPRSGQVTISLYLGNAFGFVLFFIWGAVTNIPWLLRLGGTGNAQEEFVFVIVVSIATSVYYTSLADLTVCYFVLLCADSAAARTVIRNAIPIACGAFLLEQSIVVLQRI